MLNRKEENCMQHERLIDALRHTRTGSAAHLPDHGERRRGLEVELLLGGFRLPGVLEYHVNDDRITLTLKHMPSRGSRGVLMGMVKARQ